MKKLEIQNQDFKILKTWIPKLENLKIKILRKNFNFSRKTLRFWPTS